MLLFVRKNYKKGGMPLKTIKEFCEIFRITPKTFNEWKKNGIVNVVQINKRVVRITDEEIERIKNNNN